MLFLTYCSNDYFTRLAHSEVVAVTAVGAGVVDSEVEQVHVNARIAGCQATAAVTIRTVVSLGVAGCAQIAVR